MSGPSFDRVVDKLRQVTVEAAANSGEWTKFVCPAHDDTHPSLGVKYDPRREKTIVVCFANCPQEAVLDAADITVRDLFDHLPDRGQSASPHRRRPAATPAEPVRRAPRQQGRDLGSVIGPRRRVVTYTYTTAANEPVGQVIRTAIPHEHGIEKGFYQRRWDAGQQSWVAGGFAPVLYQAPIVAWAITEGHPILVCEGEKDVDRAIAAGYPATCNVAGAGKFRPEHADQLRGARRVVIVADRDRAGFDHALAVHDQVRGLVDEIDVLQAATGKDLSDHFDAGHGINDLTLIPPDQIALYLDGQPHHSRRHAANRTPTASVPGQRPHRPDLEWGLDR